MQTIAFVNFDFQKLFSVSFHRKFLPLFQNRQKEVWQILTYFKNFIFELRYFENQSSYPLSIGFPHKRIIPEQTRLFDNFWPPSFSGAGINTSLKIFWNFRCSPSIFVRNTLYFSIQLLEILLPKFFENV